MLVTSVYLQVSTEVAMLMQIRALRDSDLQRDRLVRKHWNEVAMSRGGEGWGLVTRAYHPCYRVLSLLYSSKAYSGINPGFLITYCVTNHYINVCFIIYSMNKVHGVFYVSFLFMFFNKYITNSYCLYNI